MTCASPDYLAARGTPRTPEDLVGHDCISFAGFIAPDVWTFVRDDTSLAVQVHSRLVVSNVEAACNAAHAQRRRHHRRVQLSHRGRTQGRNAEHVDDFQPPAVPVNLVYTAGRFLPLKLRALPGFCRPKAEGAVD